MREFFNTSDTRVPNISLELLPDASCWSKIREHFVILLMLDADPRQSAVTLLSSPETNANVSCLIMIEIAGFSETEPYQVTRGTSDKDPHLPSMSKSPPGTRDDRSNP